MGESSAGTASDAYRRAWARVERSVVRLNAGDPEPLLNGYVDDVVVVAPLSDVEDPATDFTLRGRAAYRAYLLTFLGYHGGFDMTGLDVEPGRLVISVSTRSGERKRLDVSLNAEGKGTRVAIFHEG